MEVRIIKEREESLRRVYLIEPDDQYFPQANTFSQSQGDQPYNKSSKYYQFEDIDEVAENVN